MNDFSNHDDVALIALIVEQDRNAFAELFGRYAVKIKAFILRAGASDQDADEVAQEVMVTVWRKAHQFDPAKAAVSTWIYTIARNRRIDLLRKRARPEPDPDDPLFQPAAEPTGHEALSAQELSIAVREAIAALPDDQRAALHAAFYDGLSHAEIAERDRLPLGTVKSRIRLAFKALRQSLGENVVEAFLDD